MLTPIGFVSDRFHIVLAVPSKIISPQEFTQTFVLMTFRAQRAKFRLVDFRYLGSGRGFKGASRVVHGASWTNTRLLGWRRQPSNEKPKESSALLQTQWVPQFFRRPIFLVLWIQRSKFWTEVGNKLMKLDQEPPRDKAGPEYRCPWGVLERAAKPLLPLQRALKLPLFSFGSALCGSRKFDI